jgi:hypothetical protein
VQRRVARLAKPARRAAQQRVVKGHVGRAQQVAPVALGSVPQPQKRLPRVGYPAAATAAAARGSCVGGRVRAAKGGEANVRHLPKDIASAARQ